jgi:hypothetical protein
LLAKRGKHAAMGDFQSSGEKTGKMEDNCTFLPNMYCTQALSPRSEVKKIVPLLSQQHTEKSAK